MLLESAQVMFCFDSCLIVCFLSQLEILLKLFNPCGGKKKMNAKYT